MKNGDQRSLLSFLGCAGIVAGFSFLCSSVSVRAQDTPVFVPTSGWLVGPASLARQEDETVQMPCIMMNHYDNGFSVRFSAGGKRIHALALDFGQSSFTAGSDYPVKISVGPSFDMIVQGTAYSESTLIANTQKLDGFYELVGEGQTVVIGVEGKDFEFMLIGADEALERVESCYGGTKKHAAAASRQERPAPDVPMPADSLPKSGIKTLEGTASHPQEEKKSSSAADEKSGEVNEKTEKNPPDGQPLAQSWMPPARDRETVKKQLEEIVDAAADHAKKAEENQWQAAQGADLREILEKWSEKGDVDLIWMAKQEFSVPEDMGVRGAFEDAVLALLEQFEDMETRPVGRIQVDPFLEKRALVIEVKREM